MKNSLILASILAFNTAIAGSVETVTTYNPAPRTVSKTMRKHHKNVSNVALASSPIGLVSIPADVDVIDRKTYNPIDGIIYRDTEVQVTPHYVQTATVPLAAVTHATLNLNELGWNLPLVESLSRLLPNLRSLTIVGGTIPEQAYLPVIRILVSRVNNLTFEYSASNKYERTDALDCLADLVRHAKKIERIAINAQLIVGNGSLASVRDLNTALKGCHHLRTFKLIPSSVSYDGRMYENAKRLSELLDGLDLLVYIDLSNNSLGLGTDGRPALRDVISTIVKLPNVQSLSLGNNDIGTEPDGQAKVALTMDLLSQMKKLKVLNLSDNTIEFGPNADAKVTLVRNVFTASSGLVMKVGDTPFGHGLFIVRAK